MPCWIVTVWGGYFMGTDPHLINSVRMLWGGCDVYESVNQAISKGRHIAGVGHTGANVEAQEESLWQASPSDRRAIRGRRGHAHGERRGNQRILRR